MRVAMLTARDSVQAVDGLLAASAPEIAGDRTNTPGRGVDRQ
ncbi:MAG: hypothetical protein U0531_15650 [Dehalococcoidia bacterium]